MKIKNITTVLVVAFILVSCAPAVTVVSPTEATIPTFTFTPVPPTPSSTPISPIKPSSVIEIGELSIQEFELKEPPDSESRSFEPVNGIESAILAEHQVERGNFTKMSHAANYTPLGDGTQIFTSTWDGKQIRAEQNFQDAGSTDTRTIIVTLDKIELLRLKIEHAVMPSYSLQGLWVFDKEWFIETVANSSGQNPYGVGEVFQTGQSLNKLYGYDETFGFQSLSGKPFYFYKQNKKIGIIYDGQSLPVEYDNIPHYGCCSAGGINPNHSENMVSFFAKHDRKWYYIEIGVFKP
jgi:hypothetical protein